eukprot:2222341-Pleurochrysis_carterae.AAC.1
MLSRFEEDANGMRLLNAAEHRVALERFAATYRMVGLPINMPFTDTKPLIERVAATNIFLSDGPKIQFVLTAYVHAYPNNVFSAWVYVASLEDMRAGEQARLR